MVSAWPIESECRTHQRSGSAAWAEDVEELLQALLRFQQQHYHGRDVSVWICTLANFQANDGSGPSVQEQVARDPFKVVIESRDVSCMVVVHTSQEDVYTRLWCIFELFVAQDRGIDVFGAASEHYLNILRAEYSHLLQTVADGDRGRRPGLRRARRAEEPRAPHGRLAGS